MFELSKTFCWEKKISLISFLPHFVLFCEDRRKTPSPIQILNRLASSLSRYPDTFVPENFNLIPQRLEIKQDKLNKTIPLEKLICKEKIYPLPLETSLFSTRLYLYSKNSLIWIFFLFIIATSTQAEYIIKNELPSELKTMTRWFYWPFYDQMVMAGDPLIWHPSRSWLIFECTAFLY